DCAIGDGVRLLCDEVVALSASNVAHNPPRACVDRPAQENHALGWIHQGAVHEKQFVAVVQNRYRRNSVLPHLPASLTLASSRRDAGKNIPVPRRTWRSRSTDRRFLPLPGAPPVRRPPVARSTRRGGREIGQRRQPDRDLFRHGAGATNGPVPGEVRRQDLRQPDNGALAAARDGTRVERADGRGARRRRHHRRARHNEGNRADRRDALARHQSGQEAGGAARACDHHHDAGADGARRCDWIARRAGYFGHATRRERRLLLQFPDSERAARGSPERTWEIGILRLRDRDNRMCEGPVRDRRRRRRRPRDDLGSGGRLDHGADLGFLFDQVFSIDLMPNDGRKRFIEIRQLRKSFGGKPVLQGVDLEVFEGETLVVLGGSGEGKSVMLRHLNGLERPDSGEVIVEGQRLNDLSEDAMANIRKQVAMVFQGGALFDSFTVFDNVSYPLREHGDMDEPAIERRVTELLDMVGMARVEHLYPAELSGGMKKRVALARSIALQPKAVLYDEPTTGLDPLVTHKINLLIRDLQRQLGFTSVVVTHDLKSAFMV